MVVGLLVLLRPSYCPIVLGRLYRYIIGYSIRFTFTHITYLIQQHYRNHISLCSELKVRIIEYDASDFTSAEKTRHEEYVVVSFKIHPRFNPNRLSDDIAVLLLDRPINLLSRNGVNAACYPGCNNMFDYQFNNGTGVRCVFLLQPFLFFCLLGASSSSLSAMRQVYST